MNSTERQNTRRLIESNDPDLTKLTIDTHASYIDYLPPDGDWERDGKAMGRNEHIKELCFGYNLGMVARRDKLAAFCAGLASNKSIEKLVIRCCQLFGEEIFTKLIPLFEQNSNIRCLALIGRLGSSPNARFLSESLSRFNTLREFECNGGGVCDNEMETLILALASHSKLGKVDFGGNKLGERGVAALASLLTNPNCSVQELYLPLCSLTDEAAVTFADTLGICRNSKLKKLNLSSNRDIAAIGWSAIFTHLHSPHSVLENLDLSRNSIDDAAANLLGNALSNNAVMKTLNLSEMNSISGEGWRSVFDALQSPGCMLQEFDLHDSGIRDGDVNCLISSLSNNCVLRSLSLYANEHVTAEGWRAFSAVLQNPNSALEKIDLAYSSISDDAVVSFANSLVHNSKLKELFLEFSVGDVLITKWDALTDALCNESSINATFSSNHTLQCVIDPDSDEADESQLPNDLITLLRLNRDSTKIEAARRKMLKVHFSGNFNMQPFINMDLKVLPQAISWMARDEYGSSLSYQFVRYTTFFVGLGGINISENERGSKRQKNS